MRHVWLIPTLIATVVVLAGTTNEVAAASINECGRIPSNGYSVFNITTRVTSCRTARRMARRYYNGDWDNVPRRPGRTFQRGSYTCSYRLEGYEGIDMRCTATGGRVVRFHASS
jgi:hypothetical protein